MKKSIKNIAIEYIDAFSRKDSDALNHLFFEDDIVLRDWEQLVSGKHAVLAASKKLFNSIDSLEILVTNVFQNSETVVCELEISMNTERIYVVDILQFSSSKKIKRIHAYKG